MIFVLLIHQKILIDYIVYYSGLFDIKIIYLKKILSRGFIAFTKTKKDRHFEYYKVNT